MLEVSQPPTAIRAARIKSNFKISEFPLRQQIQAGFWASGPGVWRTDKVCMTASYHVGQRLHATEVTI